MSDNTIRLAIAGVGNCASSLLQGIEFYKNADPTERVPGLMHVELGGYHIRDIKLVAAFDVDADKVGIDASKAIFAGPNNTIKFSDVPELGITVQRGPTLDGFGEYYREMCEESPAEPVDVTQALRDARVDVLVSYLPVGSDAAQKHYAQACLDAGVAFVNALPVFIASDPEWAQKFTDAEVLGQLGAAHRIDDDARRVGGVVHLELELDRERHVAEVAAFEPDECPLAVLEPRHMVGRADVDVAIGDPRVDLRGDRLRLGDLLRLQPGPLEHVHEVHVPAEVELVGVVDHHAPVFEQL